MSEPDKTPAPTDTAALISSDTLATLRPIACPAGTLLFRAGDPDDLLYVVLSGDIALVLDVDTHNEQIVHVRGADAVIGEMSVLSIHPRLHRFSGRVHTDAQVLVLPRAEVDPLLRREPLLAYELLRVAGSHMHREHRRAMHILEEKNAQLVDAYGALRDAQAQLLAHERLQHELQLAREIQERMLPTVLPHMVGVDVGARIIPAHEVGGDLFDLFVLDDETLGLVIGDVCGKGIPAALYMAETRSLLRATATPDASPDVVLRRVNAHLRALNSSSMFVTCVYARLHLPTRTLLVARAGHEYPLCYTAAGTPRPLPYAVGQPLGMLPEPAIDVQRHALAAGDTVLLYTDGVTEATNATGAFFERERLHTTMQAAPRTAQDLCDVIVQQVAAFQGVAPQADDITLVAARLG